MKNTNFQDVHVVGIVLPVTRQESRQRAILKFRNGETKEERANAYINFFKEYGKKDEEKQSKALVGAYIEKSTMLLDI